MVLKKKSKTKKLNNTTVLTISLIAIVSFTTLIIFLLLCQIPIEASKTTSKQTINSISTSCKTHSNPLIVKFDSAHVLDKHFQEELKNNDELYEDTKEELYATLDDFGKMLKDMSETFKERFESYDESRRNFIASLLNKEIDGKTALLLGTLINCRADNFYFKRVELIKQRVTLRKLNTEEMQAFNVLMRTNIYSVYASEQEARDVFLYSLPPTLLEGTNEFYQSSDKYLKVKILTDLILQRMLEPGPKEYTVVQEGVPDGEKPKEWRFFQVKDIVFLELLPLNSVCKFVLAFFKMNLDAKIEDWRILTDEHVNEIAKEGKEQQLESEKVKLKSLIERINSFLFGNKAEYDITELKKIADDLFIVMEKIVSLIKFNI